MTFRPESERTPPGLRPESARTPLGFLAPARSSARAAPTPTPLTPPPTSSYVPDRRLWDVAERRRVRAFAEQEEAEEEFRS